MTKKITTKQEKYKNKYIFYVKSDINFETLILKIQHLLKKLNRTSTQVWMCMIKLNIYRM